MYYYAVILQYSRIITIVVYHTIAFSPRYRGKSSPTRESAHTCNNNKDDDDDDDDIYHTPLRAVFVHILLLLCPHGRTNHNSVCASPTGLSCVAVVLCASVIIAFAVSDIATADGACVHESY